MAETETTTASSPAISYEYIWFGGQPVAQFDAATNTPHWTFTDHLGTAILTTDTTGVVDWRLERVPFGAAYALRAGAGRHQPLAFPGQEEDASTDRSYNIFRWYRAAWTRYTQSDPAGLDDGPNLYSYVHGRPIVMIDASGLCSTCNDCPSGEWNFNNAPGFGVSAAVFWGKSVTWGTYVCKGNGREVRVRIECSIAGPIIGAGLGLSGPVGVRPMACSCSENGLSGTSGGWTAWLGPVNVDGGKCGTQAGGTTNSAGVGKSWGAGFGGTRCTTTKVQ
jgi:RHS repeat-associated protein